MTAFGYFRDFLNDLFTSKDGRSFDIARVLWALSIIWFLGLATYSVVVNKALFDALAYGTGGAALLAGGGIGVGAKRKDEPDA